VYTFPSRTVFERAVTLPGFFRKPRRTIVLGIAVIILSSAIYSGEKKDRHKNQRKETSVKNESRLEYDKLEGGEYISLQRFKSVVKHTRVDFDPILLTAKIIHGKKTLRIQVDSKFYAVGDDLYSLEFAPVYHKNDIYLPRPLVEEVFTELALPVSYKFEKKNITVVDEPKMDVKINGIDFIVIDPGHGGRDPGASSGTSVIEKKITMEVAEYLDDLLKREFPGVRIYMTRHKDVYVALEKRADIANDHLEKNNFGIFISLHCNATLERGIHGYEVFYLSQNPGSEEDRKVMMRENDLVSSGDPDIDSIESYLLNSQILAESKMLARQLNRTLMTELSGQVSSRGVRKADFRVLRKSLMPAVLIEMGYISNSDEAAVLQTGRYKKNLGDAISSGIKNFIKYRPKM